MKKTPQPDICMLQAYIRHAYLAAFGKEISRKGYIEVAKDIFERPAIMPPYLRKFVIGCDSGNSSSTMLWLKQYV